MVDWLSQESLEGLIVMVACKDAAGGGSARWDVEDSEAMLETGLAALQGILGYSGVPFCFREPFGMLAVGRQPRFTREAHSSALFWCSIQYAGSYATGIMRMLSSPGWSYTGCRVMERSHFQPETH